MTYPLRPPGFDAGRPGCSYAAVLVRAPVADVLGVLRAVRFTGWVAPPEAGAGWTVAVASTGTVAAGRRGIVGVGAALAALAVPVVAVRVVDDRQLALVGWDGGAELGRYVSDPSYGADDDVLPDPLGTELAGPLARACAAAGADPVAEVLAEQLDPDSVNESERLVRLLDRLGLPAWLVAVDSLPRDIPTGPQAAELTRLRAGRPGPAGRLAAAGTRLTRRRPPPPVVADPPRAAPDPWSW